MNLNSVYFVCCMDYFIYLYKATHHQECFKNQSFLVKKEPHINVFGHHLIRYQNSLHCFTEENIADSKLEAVEPSGLIHISTTSSVININTEWKLYNSFTLIQTQSKDVTITLKLGMMLHEKNKNSVLLSKNVFMLLKIESFKTQCNLWHFQPCLNMKFSFVPNSNPQRGIETFNYPNFEEIKDNGEEIPIENSDEPKSYSKVISLNCELFWNCSQMLSLIIFLIW